MIRLRRPSARDIEAALVGPFSYEEVGATEKLDAPDVRAALVARYDIDRYDFPLGRGRAVFDRARAALVAWKQFDIPWLRLHGAGPVATGQQVATVTRVAGLWFVNPCRVVYVDDSKPDAAEYAYGTLAGHAECGEERFRVFLDPASDEVRYEIAAFSRPAVLLTKLGYPFARRIQRRFAGSSGEAMIKALR